MTVIGALFLVGVIFLGLEIFLPGGILGVFAGIALIGGIVLAFVDYGVGGGALAFVVALVLIGIVLYLEIAILPKTRMGKRFFLQSAISGTTSETRESDLTGKSGVTSTVLGPSGYITIDGHRHEAYSRAGLLEKDVPVKVVGADNFRLIVTPEN